MCTAIHLWLTAILTLPEYSQITTVNVHNPKLKETIVFMEARLKEAEESRTVNQIPYIAEDAPALSVVFGRGKLDCILQGEQRVTDVILPSLYKDHRFQQYMYQFDLNAWENVDLKSGCDDDEIYVDGPLKINTVVTHEGKLIFFFVVCFCVFFLFAWT